MFVGLERNCVLVWKEIVRRSEKKLLVGLEFPAMAAGATRVAVEQGHTAIRGRTKGGRIAGSQIVIERTVIGTERRRLERGDGIRRIHEGETAGVGKGSAEQIDILGNRAKPRRQ